MSDETFRNFRRAVESDHDWSTTPIATHHVVGLIDEISRLKKRLADRERRIRLAREAIPVGDDMDAATDSKLHRYSRVSERTIQEVEAVLDLRRPLPKGKR